MIMKFNVAPSKHKGLINILKMATDSIILTQMMNLLSKKLEKMVKK
jgi:hypothetical protein